MSASLEKMNGDTLSMLNAVQERMLTLPQVEIQTEHIIHGGMYSRTIRIDAGVVVIGAMVKVPTVLIVVGSTAVFVGDRWIEIEGTHVIPASPGRKQIVVTREPTSFTMIFRTDAKTVEEAEREFTDEAECLMSRKSDSDVVLITEE